VVGMIKPFDFVKAFTKLLRKVYQKCFGKNASQNPFCKQKAFTEKKNKKFFWQISKKSLN
jgi:hypothetical protein